MIFRRPELEKDNPIAPEPYVGPRRRLAMARAAVVKNEAHAGKKMKETLRALVCAAARFLMEQPNVSKSGKNRVALRDAIAKADEVLAADARSKGSRKARR